MLKRVLEVLTVSERKLNFGDVTSLMNSDGVKEIILKPIHSIHHNENAAIFPSCYWVSQDSDSPAFCCKSRPWGFSIGFSNDQSLVV